MSGEKRARLDRPVDPDHDGPESTPTPATRGRRWRVLAFSLAAFGVAFFAILSGLSYFAYRHRVQLVNQVTAHLSLPFDVSIGNLSFLGPNKLGVDGIELRERGTDRVILRSEKATWQFRLGQLRRGQLGNLEIRGARLTPSPEDIEYFTGSRPGFSTNESAPTPNGRATTGTSKGIAWESLRLTDIEFSYPGDARLPPLSGKLQFEGAGASFSQKQGIQVGRQRLEITDLAIGGRTTDPITARIPTFHLELTAASNELLHLESVELDAGSLSAKVRELLARLGTSAGKDRKRGRTPALLIDRLAIRTNRLEVDGAGRTGPGSVVNGLEIAADRLSINQSGGSTGDLAISLTDAEAGALLPEGIAFSVGRASIEGQASWGETTDISISHADLVAPRLRVDLEKVTDKKPLRNPLKSDAGESTDSSHLALRLDDTLVKNAHFEIIGNDKVTNLTTNLDIEADGWQLRNGRLDELPESLQTLRIHDLEASFAGTTTPATVADLTLQITPRIFAKNGTIQSLELKRIDVDLEGAEFLASIDPGTEAPAHAAAHETPEAPSRPIHADPSRWIFETFRIDGGHINMPAVEELGIPHIETDIAVSTPEAESLPAGTHDISLLDVSVSTGHERPPFYRSEEITARINYRELWRGSGLEAFRIDGGTLIVDDDLARLIPAEEREEIEFPEKDHSPGEKATDHPLARLLPDLRQMAVADTRIILKDIAPGIRTVIFSLEKEPGKQRIELAHIEITSPYNTLRPVARLNTIFIEFTLPGLLAKTIDKVEIVNPTIFVGEHLFWFIEHYRTYGKPEEADGKPQKGWDIGEIHAYNGKLVIAPKGTPIPGLEVPFPFSCRTRLGEGAIEANLTIQNGDYAIPDIKILLEDLEGTVEFNLPIKQVDNNLVQVLKARKLRFRQLEGSDPWVSFTYDQNGIYTRFGAEAYGGYVEGEANVYIDDDYTWDAWASMSNVETDPITRVITPTYFRMRGKSDATIIASGNIKELFQANGTFASHAGGEIDVRALEGLEGRIDAASPLTLWLAEAGIDLLQHFRYDSAEGKFKLLGREGELDFLLAGPDGKREFQVVVHDHRPTEEREKPSS